MDHADLLDAIRAETTPTVAALEAALAACPPTRDLRTLAACVVAVALWWLDEREACEVQRDGRWLVLISGTYRGHTLHVELPSTLGAVFEVMRLRGMVSRAVERDAAYVDAFEGM